VFCKDYNLHSFGRSSGLLFCIGQITLSAAGHAGVKQQGAAGSIRFPGFPGKMPEQSGWMSGSGQSPAVRINFIVCPGVLKAGLLG